MRVFALIACHNRKALTVASVLTAYRCAVRAGWTISFIVYDDGSTDGTSDALAALPFDVHIIRGDGTAFWARSMATAESFVLNQLASWSEDYILWLNDDVRLDESSFVNLGRSIEEHPGAIIVGAVRDPITGDVTYSGMRKGGVHPLGFDRVYPSDRHQDISTFNGNIVAVPIARARELGGIDGEFSHGLADIDYGLRSNRLGFPVLLAPQTFGTCPRNKAADPGPILGDWRRFTGMKGGGNFSSLRRILSKGHPVTWPTYIFATYALWWARRLLRGIARS